MALATRGFNYGVIYLTGDVDAQITSDLLWLKGHAEVGKTPIIRISYPHFDSAYVTYWVHVCEMAKALGFYVLWGISAPSNFTTQEWSNCLATFQGLAPTLVGIVDEFGMNEEDLHNNTGTVTTMNVQNDIATTLNAASISTPASIKFTYCTAGERIADWVGRGISWNGYIAFNIYDSLANFVAYARTARNAFGDNVHISEYGNGAGFGSNTELVYEREAVNRTRVLEALGYKMMFFYTHHGNLPWDIAIDNSKREYHDVWYALTGSRRPRI